MAFFVSAVVAAVDLGTVAAVATAVSEVGVAMSVVGAVTGNQTLTKVGGVMSLAGGAVGLADGAFGGAADAVDSGSGGLSGPTPDGGNISPSAGSGPMPDGSNLASSDTASGATTGAVPDPNSGASGAIPLPTPDQPDSAFQSLDPSNGLATGNYAAPPGETPLTADQASAEELQGNQNLAALSQQSAPGATSAATAPLAGSQGANELDSSIANPSTGTAGAPQAAPSIATPGAANPVGATTPISSTTQGTTVNNAVNSLTPGEMAGTSANLPASSGNVQPAGGLNSLPTTPSGFNPNTGAAGATTSAPTASDGYFSGALKFAQANPMATAMGGQVIGSVLSGIAQAPLRNAQVNALNSQTSIANQRQANLNSQPTYGGIIANARKNANSGS